MILIVINIAFNLVKLYLKTNISADKSIFIVIMNFIFFFLFSNVRPSACILGLPGLQKICFGTWETAKLHYMFTREDVRVISKKKKLGAIEPPKGPKAPI